MIRRMALLIAAGTVVLSGCSAFTAEVDCTTNDQGQVVCSGSSTGSPLPPEMSRPPAPSPEPTQSPTTTPEAPPTTQTPTPEPEPTTEQPTPAPTTTTEAPPPVTTAPPAPQALTAAERYGWGTPIPQASDEFNYNGVPDQAKWYLAGGGVDKCWPGHAGNGRRCDKNTRVANGVLVQTGEAGGDSGWLGSRFDQQYGRWEARVRSYATADSGRPYHPLLIIWPESNMWPEHGEYDFLENGRPGMACAEAFIHYPHPDNVSVQQEYAKETDCGAPLSEWHNVAIEWTPDHIKGFIDGKEWFSYSDGAGPNGRSNIQDMPKGHLTIQLDNFHGSGMQSAKYEVDWVRIYAPR